MASISEIPEVCFFSSPALILSSLPLISFIRISYFRIHFQNLRGNVIIPLENQPNMIYLGPMGNPDPTSIINLETNKIPMKSSDMNLD